MSPLFAAEPTAADRSEDRYVEIGSARIAYRVVGRIDRAPLLMLQRFRGTMDHWDPLLLDALARERRVIVFDNVGVGASTGEVPPSIQAMAVAADAFIDAIGEDEIDVLGWSMGGAVAQHLALAHPGRIRRLVLAATGPGGVKDAPPLPAQVWQVAAKPENNDDDFLYLFYADGERSREAGRASLARLVPRLERSHSAVSADGVRRQIAAIQAFGDGRDAARPRLAEIAHPALVASGARDIMVHPYSTFVLSQELRDAELVLYPDAGHAFLFQHAERFARRVLEFLR